MSVGLNSCYLYPGAYGTNRPVYGLRLGGVSDYPSSLSLLFMGDGIFSQFLR